MKRLQFVVQDNVYENLENLREKTGAASLAEVFRDALRAFSWVVSELEGGREVISRAPDAQAAQARAFSPFFKKEEIKKEEIKKKEEIPDQLIDRLTAENEEFRRLRAEHQALD